MMRCYLGKLTTLNLHKHLANNLYLLHIYFYVLGDISEDVFSHVLRAPISLLK